MIIVAHSSPTGTGEARRPFAAWRPFVRGHWQGDYGLDRAAGIVSEGRFVVIGAGQAGTRAALTLVAAGARHVVLIGDEPHPPYERPPLSKEVLAGTRSLDDTFIDKAGQLAAGGVRIVTATAIHIDRDARRVLLGDGLAVPYDRLLLATGRSARTLPEAVAHPRPFTLRSAADALRLRQRLPTTREALVIGGGLIGLEVAASLAATGIRTEVVELAGRLMARAVPPEIASLAQDHHRRAGLSINLGLAVAAYGADGTVRLADGRTQRPDLLLLAIGSTPNTDLAAAAGIAVGRGILVDTQLETSDPAIFAAGDVVEMRRAGDLHLFENWTSADSQGALAARNMLGAGEAWSEATWFWSDQGAFALEGVGDPAGGDHVVRDYADGGRVVFTLGGRGDLRGVFGAGARAALRDVRFGRQLLAQGSNPSPGDLADPAVPLRGLLRGR